MIEVVVHRKRSGGQFMFGAPLFVIWLVLAPIGILVLPLVLLTGLFCDFNPFPAISIFCRLLAALKGTQVELEDSNRTFELRVA